MDMNPYGRASTPNEETCGYANANPADFHRPTAPVGDERLRDGNGKYCGFSEVDRMAGHESNPDLE